MMSKGIHAVHYYPTWEHARDALREACREFPMARIVRYERGFAIQVCRSGDYLTVTLRPTMEA